MSWNKSKLWWIVHRFSWLDRKQKTTINSINKKGSKCFLYAVTVTLNHEETGKNPERITKIKPFLNKYKIMNLKKLEKNNVTIALKV